MILPRGIWQGDGQSSRNPANLGVYFNIRGDIWFFGKTKYTAPVQRCQIFPSFGNFIAGSASVPMETSRGLPQTWYYLQVAVGYEGEPTDALD